MLDKKLIEIGPEYEAPLRDQLVRVLAAGHQQPFCAACGGTVNCLEAKVWKIDPYAAKLTWENVALVHDFRVNVQCLSEYRKGTRKWPAGTFSNSLAGYMNHLMRRR